MKRSFLGGLAVLVMAAICGVPGPLCSFMPLVAAQPEDYTGTWVGSFSVRHTLTYKMTEPIVWHNTTILLSDTTAEEFTTHLTLTFDGSRFVGRASIEYHEFSWTTNDPLIRIKSHTMSPMEFDVGVHGYISAEKRLVLLPDEQITYRRTEVYCFLREEDGFLVEEHQQQIDKDEPLCYPFGQGLSEEGNFVSIEKEGDTLGISKTFESGTDGIIETYQASGSLTLVSGATLPTATAHSPGVWASTYDEYYSSQQNVTITVNGYSGEAYFRFETDPSFGVYNEIIEGFQLSLDGPHVIVSGQTVDVLVSIEDRLKRGPSEYNQILPLDVVLKPVVVLEGAGYPYEYVRANPLHIMLCPKWGYTTEWTNPPEGNRVAGTSGSGYYVRKAGSEDWVRIGETPDEIYLGAGDSIRGSRTPVAMTWLESSIFGEGNRLDMSGDATLVLPRAEDPTILDLVAGRIRSVIKALRPTTKFEIRTAVCILGVRGTDYLVDAEVGTTNVLVLEGSVEVSDLRRNKTVLLGAGEKSAATATTLPSDPERFDLSLLAERYGGLFSSQQELDKIVKAIPETLALAAGFMMLAGKMARPRWSIETVTPRSF